MKIKSSYLMEPHRKVRLSRLSTTSTGHYKSKEEADADLERHRQKLDQLQELLAADGKHSVLIVLQGMDGSGKDGTIRHIFTGVNPQACDVTCFKVPTPLEQQHDFLWRVHRAVPRAGTIGIFNRSHYEDVLVPRVHKTVSKEEIQARLQQIVDFEHMLAQNHTLIFKFFLHISRKEQAARFQSRLDEPKKHWKLSEADFTERKFWPQYAKAYEDAMQHTSHKHAPWFIIPSDNKWYRNVALSKILVDGIGGLKMEYPKASFDVSKVKL